MSDTIYAKAFGVDYPVCNAEQKEALEAAYKVAMQYEKDHPEELEHHAEKCSCDLIITLLNGTASKVELISAGIMIARDLYTSKEAVRMITEGLRDAVLRSMPIQGGLN